MLVLKLKFSFETFFLISQGKVKDGEGERERERKRGAH